MEVSLAVLLLVVSCMVPPMLVHPSQEISRQVQPLQCLPCLGGCYFSQRACRYNACRPAAHMGSETWTWSSEYAVCAV